MPLYHTVKPGDYLSKIARQHGYTDFHVIWDHPENAELKRKRKNPNILFAGDRLFIPDKQTKTESVATEQRHRFQVKGGSLLLRIVLKDIDDEPIAQAACALEVDGAEHFLTTDANGLIEQAIPGTAERGTLTIDDPDVLLDIEGLRIGHLDPVDTPSGQQARLNNLGYYIDTADRPEEEELRSAVEEFQCDHGLTVDGDCGPNTQAKLTEVHGC